MQITLAIAALAAAVYGQDCSTSSQSGLFQLNPVNLTQSNSGGTTDCSAYNITLNNGVLKDSHNRQGEIVSNFQLQFDAPLQAGNKDIDGFSVCSNGSLALKGNAIFYQCNTNSGQGNRLYSPKLSPVTGQCFPIYLIATPCSGSGSSGSGGSGGASVTPASDGQPFVTSCVPVTQTSDGQLFVSSCPTISKCVPVTQTSDGQLFVSSCPTAKPTSKCVPVTQTSDGQLFVSSCNSTTPTTPTPKPTQCVPVTQTSDGQLFVSSCPAPTTSKCVPVTQTSDGQLFVSTCPTSGVAAATGSAPTASSTFLGITSSANNIAMGSQVVLAILAAAVVAFL